MKLADKRPLDKYRYAAGSLRYLFNEWTFTTPTQCFVSAPCPINGIAGDNVGVLRLAAAAVRFVVHCFMTVLRAGCRTIHLHYTTLEVPIARRTTNRHH